MASNNVQPISTEIQNTTQEMSPLDQDSALSSVKTLEESNQTPVSSESTESSGRGWRFWAIFPPLCIASLLVAMETSVPATALPVIATELNSGDNYVWIMNGYLLTVTAFQPLYGQFAGVLGRRWPQMFAVAVFILGSGICGGATSTTMLIAGRVVQGIGGSGITVLTNIIVSDIVSVRERGTFMGIIFAVITAGCIIGPVISGVIVQNGAWRWVFWFNVPIGGLTLVLQFFFLQVSFTKRLTFAEKMRQIDWVGNFMLVGSVVSVLIALSWADTRYSWSSWRIIVPLILGFAGMGAFHTYEASPVCKQPTVPSRIFGNRTTAVAIFLTFCQAMLMYWRLYFLPIYFQSVLLTSPSRAGVLLLPTIATGMPFAVVGGSLLTKFGRYKPIHLVGFAVYTLTAGLYVTLNADSSLAEVVIFQLIDGIAGCILTTILPAVQAGLPQQDVAVATGAWGFFRAYGGIWGIAIPAAIFNSRFSALLSGVSDPTVAQELSAGHGYSHVSRAYITSLPAGVREEVVSAYLGSLKLVWQVAIAFAGLCFVLVFVEKEINMSTTVSSEYGLKEKKKAEDSEANDAHVVHSVDSENKEKKVTV